MTHAGNNDSQAEQTPTGVVSSDWFCLCNDLRVAEERFYDNLRNIIRAHPECLSRPLDPIPMTACERAVMEDLSLEWRAIRKQASDYLRQNSSDEPTPAHSTNRNDTNGNDNK